MAGSAGLSGRWLLVAVVGGLHAALLEYFARDLENPSALTAMAPVMLTRTLTPTQATPVQPEFTTPTVAPARSRTLATPVAQPPRAGASAAVGATATADGSERSGQPGATLTAESSAGDPLNTPAAASIVSSPVVDPARDVAAVASPPSMQLDPVGAAPPGTSPPTQAAPSWPETTRLSYQLDGRFRSGDLYGSAQVFWQREQAQYQVRVDVDITLFAKLSMVSQGVIDGEQLVPRIFEEIRPGRKRRTARFEAASITLDNGNTVDRPANTQDAASQFVQLTHDFASGRVRLDVGRSVELWMARPGGVDRWTYDVVALEEITTPGFGRVSAYHLRPRPILRPRGNITMEMWYAPSLQYLPVRIRLQMGEEAVLDLTALKVEQR